MHVRMIWQRRVRWPNNSRRTGNDIEVEEEEQRVLSEDAKSKGVKEQGLRSIN